MEYCLKYLIAGTLLWLWGYFQSPPEPLRVEFVNVPYMLRDYNTMRGDMSSIPAVSRLPSLDVNTFDSLKVKTVVLDQRDTQDFLSVLYFDQIDSVTTGLCYYPRHAFRITFADDSQVVLGFCLECHTGERYGFYSKNVIVSNRFWRYLKSLKDKHGL